MPNFHSKAEQRLYDILKALLGPYEPINVNFRPSWLQRRETIRSRLEIDFWLPRHKVAIELQGAQHYKQVGQASGLKNIQRRDTWKKEKVMSLGYVFIEIRTNEIDKEFVRQKLNSIGVIK